MILSLQRYKKPIIPQMELMQIADGFHTHQKPLDTVKKARYREIPESIKI